MTKIKVAKIGMTTVNQPTLRRKTIIVKMIRPITNAMFRIPTFFSIYFFKYYTIYLFESNVRCLVFTRTKFDMIFLDKRSEGYIK